MARPPLQTVRTAKANVRRWFVETSVGPAFLPGDGRALPLGADEATAIRASAESRIAATLQQANRWVMVLFVIMVGGVGGIQTMLPDLEPGGFDIVGTACTVLYVGGALLIADIYWRWERGILLLREAIAHSLCGRSSLPPEIAGPRARPEPPYRELGKIVFGLLALGHIVLVVPEFYGESASLAESAQWLAIFAGAIVAAVLFYVLGDAALRALPYFSSENGPRR